VYQVRAFEEYRRQFLVDIASRYFDLVTAQQNLANQRTNYLTLLELTRQTEALYVASQINFLEVQRSFQSQLSAESSLVNAQQTYQSLLDQFKIVLGMPIEQPLGIEPVELSLHIPDDGADEAVAMALRYRLDLQTARDQIDDNRRQVQVAENRLLPDLSLFANGQLANSPGTAASRIDPHNAFTYSAGVTLDLPVDRLSERNDYRRALINFHRSERGFQQLRDQISVAARDALRRIQQAQVSLRIQRLGIELAQRRLDYSNELLRQGQADARDVVESQNSLISASEAFERARAQLQTSLLQYLQETGTLRVDPGAGMLGQALQRDKNTDSFDEKTNKVAPAR
jgi:outer membrane protein TolC